jgi:hypothetical protein
MWRIIATTSASSTWWRQADQPELQPVLEQDHQQQNARGQQKCCGQAVQQQPARYPGRQGRMVAGGQQEMGVTDDQCQGQEVEGRRGQRQGD